MVDIYMLLWFTFTSAMVSHHLQDKLQTPYLDRSGAQQGGSSHAYLQPRPTSGRMIHSSSVSLRPHNFTSMSLFRSYLRLARIFLIFFAN